MGDDDRLELDDDGHVVGSSHVVDLMDADATEQLHPTKAQELVDRHVTPWLQRHRIPVVALTVVGLVAGLGAAWWTHRPPYVPPPVPLSIENAVLGRDIGGPVIRDDGRLLVAFTARATDRSVRFDVLDLVGPGLASTGVTVDRPATTDSPSRVQAEAVVQCSDPDVLRARSTDFGLRVRRTDGDGVSELTVPLGPEATPLDVALREHCLQAYAAPALSIVDARLVGQAGSSIASLALVVRNVSNLPVEVATQRGPDGGVDVDLSTDVTIAPQRAAIVSSRVQVQDCSPDRVPLTEPLTQLPSPMIGSGYVDPSTASGITLRVGLGTSSMLASYGLGPSLDLLAGRLRTLACGGTASVSSTIASASGRRAPDGSWTVAARIALRTTGIGVTVGRERFSGPPWGAGSQLVTDGASSRGWEAEPAQLDGGAGSVQVVFAGTSCDDASAPPTHLPLRVVTADRVVHPFVARVDPTLLRAAWAEACTSP
ncbi:MAG TPA: hypothetical protein VFL59_09715 [Candidatus Nanopelagicales bacterium]|nr:hypothetical protein [Candidatus Nanopelagicales bacterium]